MWWGRVVLHLHNRLKCAPASHQPAALAPIAAGTKLPPSLVLGKASLTATMRGSHLEPTIDVAFQVGLCGWVGGWVRGGRCGQIELKRGASEGACLPQTPIIIISCRSRACTCEQRGYGASASKGRRAS